MGYDQLGRDLFDRVLLGRRISLGASLLATGVGFVLGIPWGIIAGSSSQIVDDVLMRTIDIVWAFPGLLLALCVSALLGPGVWNAALTVGERLPMVGCTSSCQPM